MIAEAVVALLLLASGAAALVAALGLWRLPDFFLRMHAPAVCYTLGSWTLALASVIHFTAGTGQLALHVWLIIVIQAITAPVTTVLLSRAGLFRARQAREAVPGPLGGD
ncbi:Na+/H+ antiporter subunit G [Caenimonas sedimenti]|uniref:Na+/H+ antiporter subunit G n=1 Tax=Caenimonas sedimenti TaxID=2596921 RepID=A0A562ZJL9_9BURK|nr:monovalent cation/H(+) antiporter subunit G [Caenimonas sedimenti]TWO68518.1 Na+/H+ antiporter subunit G [Caenimonas sedimenti]